jgi:hypothetical protein
MIRIMRCEDTVSCKPREVQPRSFPCRDVNRLSLFTWGPTDHLVCHVKASDTNGGPTASVLLPTSYSTFTQQLKHTPTHSRYSHQDVDLLTSTQASSRGRLRRGSSALRYRLRYREPKVYTNRLLTANIPD